MKLCKCCEQLLPFDQFNKALSAKDGLQSYCRECNSIASRQYQYGLTREEVLAFTSVPVCQACGEAFRSNKSQHIDHCHCTKVVRGVLCAGCNKFLHGTWAQSLRRVIGALNYLIRSGELVRERRRAS